jgi:secreted Zn-dependent insulinase-like peptidase
MNAFTESQRTTYYFDVTNTAFNKSLHIFSRMFAEPIFDINYMNKEIDAVNSEAEKNINSDAWRKRQLFKSLAIDNHPYRKFSTGNTETLRGISSEKLNKKLKDFYEKYYKSFNMKLAIISNSTLDDIQRQTFEIFSDIRGKEFSVKTPSYGKIGTNKSPYSTDNLGKVLFYKRISTGNILDFMFVLNSTRNYNEIKPLDYLDYMLKYSGDKSLLEFLKKKNLATKLDSSIYESYDKFTIYSISMEITDEGLNQIDSILKLTFNYINKIKNTKKEKKIYDEIKKIYDISFKFQEKSDDYTGYVSTLSTSMFDIEKRYQYQSLLYWDYMHMEYDGELIDKLMSEIKIDNSIIMIGSHNDINDEIKNQFFKTSEIKKEKWYGTEYMVNNFDVFYMDNLNQYPVDLQTRTNKGLLVDTLKTFGLRSENKFISKMINLVSSCSELNIKCENEEFDYKNPDFTPITLIDNPNLSIFYKIDKTFKVPKTYAYIYIISDSLKTSIESFSNFRFFSEYLEYTLNTNLSEAVEAGNSVSLEFDDAGLTINISSYSDIMDKIIEIILNDLFKLQPNEFTFKEIYESSIKSIQDNKIKKPVMKNKLFFNKLIKFNNTLYTDIIDYYYTKEQIQIQNKNNTIANNYNNNNNSTIIKNKENINFNYTKKYTDAQIFKSFVNFYENFKTKLIFNVFFYGHIETNEDISKISKMISIFVNNHSDPSLINNNNNNNINNKENKNDSNNNSISNKSISKRQKPLKDSEAESIRNSIHLHRRIDDQIIYQIKNEANNEINNGITTYYQVGPRDFQRSLSFTLIDKCIGTVFYHNLRTLQQLGYIVHAGSQLVDSILYFKIIVQGSKKTPLEVEKAINSVFLLAEEKLKKCEGNEFTLAKNSIKDILKKKDDNLKERSIKIWREIYYNTYEFDRYKMLYSHVDEIKFLDVYNLFKNIFFNNPNRITIHQYASTFDSEEINSKNNFKIDYDLNKEKKILITNNINYYANQPYLYAFKSKRFNRKIIGNKNSNKKSKKNIDTGKKELKKNSGGTGMIQKSHNFKKNEAKLKKKLRNNKKL